MEHSGTYFSKDKTKFSHELCQILDEVAHGRPTSSRLGKPCPYVVRSVNPLPGPELGFRLVSESDSDPFASELLFGGILRRTAQRASHYLDSLSLEYLSVCPIKIDFVPEEPLRLAAEPLLILVYMYCQVGSLVICIPAVMVDEGVAVHYADPHLGSELHLGLRFAAGNRSDVGLVYAYYPVLAGMGPQTQHLFLLVIHVDDSLYGALLRAVEPRVCLIVNAYEVEQREYVAVKQGKHAGDGILYEFCSLVFSLDDIEICLTYAVAFQARRPADSLYAADLVDHAVNVSGTILYEVDVRRIPDFRVGACGVRLQVGRLCPVVGGSTTVAVVVATVTPTVLFLSFSRKFKSERIDVVDGDALADSDEKRRIEYRLVGIFCQAAHILHVWILLNGQDCLLVGQVQLMLDDEGGNDHSSRTVGCADCVILQPLVVDLLIFRPWKRVTHLHPPVCFRQTLQGTFHLVKGHLTVQGYDFHVGWSSFNIKISTFLLKFIGVR